MGINIRRQYQMPYTRDMLREKFTAFQNNSANPFIIQVATHLIILKVRAEDAHWLSPEMNLRIDEVQEKSMISEVIGPNSAFFTIAMFLIWAGTITFLASSMMVLAQILVGGDHYLALLATIVSGLVIVLTLAALAWGRIKAKDQVDGMRQFAHDILKS